MNELTLEAHRLYTDMLNAVEHLSHKDDVIDFTNNKGFDLVNLFTWHVRAVLLKLATADNKVCNEEMEFYNYVLDEDIDESVVWNLNIKYEEELSRFLSDPHSISVVATFDKELALDLIDKTQTIGIYFIAVDGHNDEGEVRILASFVQSMKQQLNGYYKDTESNEIVETKKRNISGDVEISLDDLLQELHSLIGLDTVKKEVLSLTNLVKVRQLRLSHNMPIPPMSLHLVFSGNPGTGKTTVARLLSKIYKALSLLSKGHLVEVDRSGLVAGYVGQTAIKVSKIVEESLGGILFIDEAYTLTSNQDSSDYGSEAIGTLLKAMEDNRDDLVIIAAGYTDKMNSFLHSNPGLKSRFNKFIHFPDYSLDELMNIFLLLCKKSGYILTDEARESLAKLIVLLDKNRGDNFGNGRTIRNKFENVIQHQANRIMTNTSPAKEDLQNITANDFLPLLQSYQ